MCKASIGGEVLLDCLSLLVRRALRQSMDNASNVSHWIIHADGDVEVC